MSRLYGFATMIMLVLAAATCGSDDESGNGGTSTVPPPYDACARYCELSVACQPAISAATLGYSQCTWDDAAGVVSADCNGACSSVHAQRSSSDATTVDGCVKCFDDSVQGSCAPADWTAATNGCDPACDNTAFEDFYADFIAAWDLQMTCT
jgi:hypothetical protein